MFEGFNIVPGVQWKALAFLTTEGGDKSGRASVSGLDICTSLNLTASSCACSSTLFRINYGRLHSFNERDGIQRWSKSG